MGKFLNALKQLNPRTGRIIKEDGNLYNVADAAESADGISRVSEPLARAARGTGFAAGTPLISSSDHVRALLKNPAGSGVVALVHSFVAAHDQSGILPAQFHRNPTEGLPDTGHPLISTNIDDPNSPKSVFTADSGAAMSGGTAEVFMPVSGAAPARVVFVTPFVLRPGTSIGMSLDVGGVLTSGSVTVSLGVSETNEAEWDALKLFFENGGA